MRRYLRFKPQRGKFTLGVNCLDEIDFNTVSNPNGVNLHWRRPAASRLPQTPGFKPQRGKFTLRIVAKLVRKLGKGFKPQRGKFTLSLKESTGLA